jgi:Tol biopolymer transport system component
MPVSREVAESGLSKRRNVRRQTNTNMNASRYANRRFVVLSAIALVAAGTVMSPTVPASGALADVNGGAHISVKSTHQNGPIALAAVTVVDGAYGPFEIATVRKHGAPYNFLTHLSNDALNPDFTPDGKRILFWSAANNAGDAVFSVPVHGGAISQIQTGCGQNPDCGDTNPAVSPSGRELLTVREQGPFEANGCLAFLGIFKFRSDGTHPRRISPTTPDCAADLEPRWSPDGDRIVFQHAEDFGLSLWIMNSDGSQRRQLTPAGMDAGAPDWSPDGQRIVFQSPDDPTDDQTPQQLYTVHPDGSQLVQITHYPQLPGQIIKTNGARWSPDGQKLVFAHLDATTTIGPDGLHHADLFVSNPDGSNVKQINATLEKDNMPAWGPRPASDHR